MRSKSVTFSWRGLPGLAVSPPRYHILFLLFTLITGSIDDLRTSKRPLLCVLRAVVFYTPHSLTFYSFLCSVLLLRLLMFLVLDDVIFS